MTIHREALRRSLPLLRLLPLLLVLLAMGAGRASAQVPDAVQRLAPSDTVYEVRLQDGSVLYGQVVGADAQRLVLVTQAGVRVELQRAQIRAASPARGRVRDDGTVWLEDPNRTRLFFGPTGRSLAGGEGYIGAFELFLPFLAYGVTDRVTIAGGTPVFPEAIGRVFYLAPKVQLVGTERLHLSSGVLAFFGTEGDVAGILYGAGTWGSADDAISAGAGWGFAGSEVTNRPAFMLGGEKRVSRRAKLITENYLFTSRETVYDESDFSGPEPTFSSHEETRVVGLIGGGVRLFGERLTGDLGIGMAVGDVDFTCCLPLVNFVYNFGSR
jgi:hypothetical protein